ncbi:MAG TPA: hypothetical protein VK324_09390 [Tepidisphaeraceae bacterium]|nr:hypothetical protein [Tepidisphaeraceae bacterium]
MPTPNRVRIDWIDSRGTTGGWEWRDDLGPLHVGRLLDGRGADSVRIYAASQWPRSLRP